MTGSRSTGASTCSTPARRTESTHPVILHYTANRHPWNPFSGVAFQRTYRHVMTNDIYYRYLAERAHPWLRPAIDWIRRRDQRNNA